MSTPQPPRFCRRYVPRPPPIPPTRPMRVLKTIHDTGLYRADTTVIAVITSVMCSDRRASVHAFACVCARMVLWVRRRAKARDFGRILRVLSFRCSKVYTLFLFTLRRPAHRDEDDERKRCLFVSPHSRSRVSSRARGACWCSLAVSCWPCSCSPRCYVLSLLLVFSSLFVLDPRC